MSQPIESPRSQLEHAHHVDMYEYQDMTMPVSSSQPKQQDSPSVQYSRSRRILSSREVLPRRSSMQQSSGGGGNSSSDSDLSPIRSQRSADHLQHRRASMGGPPTSSNDVETDIHGDSYTERLGSIRRRRSITFNEGVAIYNIAPVKSLINNPEKLWFQEEEFEQIRQDVWDAIESIQSATKDDKTASKVRSRNKVNDNINTKYWNSDSNDENTPYPSQEVEYSIPLSPKDQKHDTTIRIGRNDDDDSIICARGLEKWISPEVTRTRRRLSLDTVMHEQHLQRLDGWYDDEQLATIYKCATVRSQKEAFIRAHQDEQDAYGEDHYYPPSLTSPSSSATTVLRPMYNRRSSM
jgi:hypothetical protein